jgi:hypothetical protein
MLLVTIAAILIIKPSYARWILVLLLFGGNTLNRGLEDAAHLIGSSPLAGSCDCHELIFQGLAK